MRRGEVRQRGKEGGEKEGEDREGRGGEKRSGEVGRRGERR